MAKRRKITAPTADDLNRIEEEFRRETSNTPNPGLAPISQISAEAAQSAPVLPADQRAEAARDKADADTLRKATEEGRVITDIPLDQINAQAMVRDRTVMDPAELEELKNSILLHGLRLPIEVYDDTDAGQGARYGLLSGYRRLWVMRELHEAYPQAGYGTIRALVRDPQELGGSFTAMVEENEIRAQLSHFERGRIAVVAAQQGAFDSTESAVNALFGMASKAKRSKIRSFAVIFEELGDMLEFPENLKERDGLRLATALRAGAEDDLRTALEGPTPASPADEWAQLEAVLEQLEAEASPSPSRGGRPRKAPPKSGWRGNTLRLDSGVTLQSGHDGDGYTIRIKGRPVDAELIKSAMEHLRYLFEKG